MPFAVIGSEKDVKTQDGRVLKGRQYSWGVAEVENEDHCDFKKLRSILIRTHMLDLIHTTEEMHYEAYRAQQMETRKFGEARPRKLDNPKFKEEEESLRKRFTEQVKVEENRFRAWEQKLISERDRLNKDLESTHAAYVFPVIHLFRKLSLTILQYQAIGDGVRANARERSAKSSRSLELTPAFTRFGGKQFGWGSCFAWVFRACSLTKHFLQSPNPQVPVAGVSFSGYCVSPAKSP